VYSSFQLAKKYFRYYRNASNSKGHGMHSPFVFDFILNVLNNGSHYDPPREIEELRKKMLADKRFINIEDLGAGSRDGAAKQKTVSQVARAALKPKRYAQVLYRLVKHYQPQFIVELGTSLGITTAYLSKANPDASITTIEGSEDIMEVAIQNLDNLRCSNIKAVNGNFDTVLDEVLQGYNSIDLGYIDGNHRYEPTVRYFHQFLEKAHAGTILVFDDIHWSDEMEKAWEEIRNHPAVQYSIDIFFLGFVFFRKEFKVKQDFVVRF
jgi:predicted O-methyltransferase YrrM